MSDEQVQEHEASIPLTEVPVDANGVVASTPPPPPPIRVKVSLVQRQYQVDTHGATMPDKKLVLAELTASQRGFIRTRYKTQSYYYLSDCMNSAGAAIPVSVWSAAIARAILKQQNPQTESVTELSTDEGFGYAAFGGHLYQLSPVSVVSTNKALAVMRKQLKDRVQVEIEAMRAAAEAAAAGVMVVANQKLAEAEEKLRVSQSNMPPPQWAVERGLMLKRVQHKWWVAIQPVITITRWVMWQDEPHEVVWEVPVEQWTSHAGVRVLCWVPLTDAEGNYNQTSVRLDPISPLLPHMTTSQACMNLGDAPARIDGHAALDRLRRGIERCFQTVNVGSLYNGIPVWRDTFKHFIPPVLAAHVASRDPYEGILHAAQEIRNQRVAAARQMPQEVTEADIFSS